MLHVVQGCAPRCATLPTIPLEIVQAFVPHLSVVLRVKAPYLKPLKVCSDHSNKQKINTIDTITIRICVKRICVLS